MFKQKLLSAFLGLVLVTSIGAVAQESDTVPFVPNDHLGDYWIAEKLVPPEYPKNSLRKGEQGCVAIGFFIEADGTTSGHRPIAAYPSNNFSQSAIRVAKQFLYNPSEQNAAREVVFTTHSFTFLIQLGKKADDEKREKLKELCTNAANKSLTQNTGTADAS